MKPLYGKSAAIHLASPSNKSGTFGYEISAETGHVKSPKKGESSKNALITNTHLVMIDDVHMPVVPKKITEEIASSAR